MKKPHYIIFLFITLFFALPGCISKLKQPQRFISKHSLEYSTAFPKKKRLESILKVREFAVAPEFNTKRIVYKNNNQVWQDYPKQEWICSPGALLTSALSQDLKKSSYFKAVIQDPSGIDPDFVLEGRVIKIYEHRKKKTKEAILGINLTLLQPKDLKAPTVLFQKTYQTASKAKENKIHSLIRAFSQGQERISSKVVQDIYTAISKQIKD